MKRASIVGVCLAAVLGAMALATGSASAVVFNKLAFTPLKEGEKVPFGTSTSVGGSRLEIIEAGPKALPILCSSASVTKGELTGPSSLTMTVSLKGCSGTSGKCTSTGGSEGEILTGALEGKLGTLLTAEGRPSIDAKNATAVTEFACGTTKVKITGGVVGSIKTAVKSGKTKLQLSWKQREGVQKEKALFGQPNDVLIPTIGEAKGNSVGLAATVNVEIAEAIAIK